MGSRHTSLLLIPVLVLATLALAMAPGAAAFHQGTTKPVDVTVSESVPLPVNNWTAYTLTLGTFESLVYSVVVTNGSEIDVYFVAEVELLNYASDTAPSFLYYEKHNATLGVAGELRGRTGAVSVIIDNVNIVPGDANPTGPVTVSVGLTRSTGFLAGGLILIGCGIALLAVALVVFVVLRRRKAAAPPPPAPYETPPGPWAPPPSSLEPEAPEGSPEEPYPPPPK